MVGTASADACAQLARNGPSLRATGFEASTSGSRSSSAARRLTNVVFASRMKSGSFAIDSRERCSLRSPIAFIIRSRFPTRAEMSGARSASAPERLRGVDDQVLERRWSTLSSPNTRREVERNGFRY